MASHIAIFMAHLDPGDVIKDQDGRWQHSCPACGAFRYLSRSVGVLLVGRLTILAVLECPHCEARYTVTNGHYQFLTGGPA